MRWAFGTGVVVMLQGLQVLQWSAATLAPALEPAAGRQQRTVWRRGDLAARLVRSTQRLLDAPGLVVSGPHQPYPQHLRRLKDVNDYSSVHGSEAKTGVVHNGTHFVRQIDAKWKCVFPDGTCFHNHAPLEGLPEKMEACVQETNTAPLTIEMTIDLHCAKMDTTIHCDSSLYKEPFDPFHTCTNDPNLLKATCRFVCKNAYAYQKCTFEFDSIGAFNMSDSTIETCSLHAECSSPYVESNAMFCSTHKANSIFKPHWESRPLPKRGFTDFGFRGPPEHKSEGPSFLLEFLWAVALLAVILGVFVILMRLGIVPAAERWKEWWQMATDTEKRRITRYRAPPVRGGSGQYVAPAAPETSEGASPASDQELERLSG